MRADGDVGLGGMVVMVGAPDMTAEAGMGLLSRSTLGLEGSSVVKTGTSSRIFESCIGKNEAVVSSHCYISWKCEDEAAPVDQETLLCLYKGADRGRPMMANAESLQTGALLHLTGIISRVTSPKYKPRDIIFFPPVMQNKRERDIMCAFNNILQPNVAAVTPDLQQLLHLLSGSKRSSTLQECSHLPGYVTDRTKFLGSSGWTTTTLEEM